MNVSIIKHIDYLTPFSEAANDDELATILRLKYPRACSNLELDAGYFARMVQDVQKYQAWRVIGFRSFEDFCEAKLGKTINEVTQIVSGVRALQSQGREGLISEVEATQAALEFAPPLQPTGRPKKGSQRPPLQKGSNSRDRLAARLKRDHPDIVKRIQAGEFKSIRAAAIAAGIVKVKTPLDQLKHWWTKANPKERKEFNEWQVHRGWNP